MPGKGSLETHQCRGVGHNKFALRFSLISPQREFPALFVLFTVPQAPALHLLLHWCMGVPLAPPSVRPKSAVCNSQILEMGQYKKSVPELGHTWG